MNFSILDIFNMMAFLLQFLRRIIYRKIMFLLCDYITIWSNFSWLGSHFNWWVLEQWNGSLVLWQQRTDWLIKTVNYGFLLVHFTFAPLEDQKHECIWKVHQETLRIKIRQNGHCYKWENHLETEILEVDSKKSRKDTIWRAEQMGYVY